MTENRKRNLGRRVYNDEPLKQGHLYFYSQKDLP